MVIGIINNENKSVSLKFSFLALKNFVKNNKTPHQNKRCSKTRAKAFKIDLLKNIVNNYATIIQRFSCDFIFCRRITDLVLVST